MGAAGILVAENEDPWGEGAAVAYRDLAFEVEQAFSADVDIVADAEISKTIFEVDEAHLIDADIAADLCAE